MAPHRWTALLCAVGALTSAVLAVLVSPWALVVAPFALVFGVAAWRGLSVGRTLQVIGDSTDDVGRGPAGLSP